MTLHVNRSEFGVTGNFLEMVFSSLQHIIECGNLRLCSFEFLDTPYNCATVPSLKPNLVKPPESIYGRKYTYTCITALALILCLYAAFLHYPVHDQIPGSTGFLLELEDRDWGRSH